MTLQEAFPGLRDAPGGTIIGVADTLFDFTGPASVLTTELSKEYSAALVRQIEAIDPHYRFQSLAVPVSFDGQINQLNGLRLDRAAAFYRIKSDIRPLQVETMRFLQARTDVAYDAGLQLLKGGKLNVRLSPQEAVGNYIDQSVRRDLRRFYGSVNIDVDKAQDVRINRREYDSSQGDLTFRRPDARVGDVAFDVTLTRKTLATAQVRGFFSSDFKPHSVVIIRPSQLGRGNTYTITRPRTR